VRADRAEAAVGRGPVFAALDRMTTEELGDLVRKIQAWLASRPKP
jgi:hypothetical protein